MATPSLATRDRAPDDPVALVAAARRLPPGPERMAALSAVALAELSPELRLDVVELWEESRRWVDAQETLALASLAAAPVHGDERWSTWEVAAALRVSEGTADDRIQAARVLVGRLPKTLAALEAGQLTYWQARDIAFGSVVLTAPEAAALEDRVLPDALTQTRPETRKAVEKAVIAINPAAAEDRRRRARSGRRVELWGNLGDGMSALYVVAPTEDIAAIHLALSDRAKRMKGRGDVETMDQGRVDALLAVCVESLQSTEPATVGATPTQVTVLADATTLAGHDDKPAEIVGHGPVTATVARRLAAGLPPEDQPASSASCTAIGSRAATEPCSSNARVDWRVLPVDPVTGWLAKSADPDLDRGRSSRFATPKQKRHIADRDRVCFMPGCNQPAHRNDVDHRNGWANDGRTDVDELGSGCGHHNRVTKTNGWTTIVGPNGTATLISPLGRRYPITPYRYWDP